MQLWRCPLLVVVEQYLQAAWYIGWLAKTREVRTLRLVAGAVAGYPSLHWCEGTSLPSSPGDGTGRLKLSCTVIRNMPSPSLNTLHTCLLARDSRTKQLLLGTKEDFRYRPKSRQQRCLLMLGAR